MRKILSSLVLMLVLTTQSIANVPAVAATDANLKSSFDKLSFELSQVDGKDPAVNQAIIAAFHAEIAELKAQGLTDADLLAYSKENMPNEQMKSELANMLTTIEINQLSEGEAKKLVVDAVKKGSATGSNYLGSSATTALYALAIVLLVVVIVAAADASCEDGTYEEYVCDDYYDSYGYYLYSDCYYDTYCY